MCVCVEHVWSKQWRARGKDAQRCSCHCHYRRCSHVVYHCDNKEICFARSRSNGPHTHARADADTFRLAEIRLMPLKMFYRFLCSDGGLTPCCVQFTIFHTHGGHSGHAWRSRRRHVWNGYAAAMLAYLFALVFAPNCGSLACLDMDENMRTTQKHKASK